MQGLRPEPILMVKGEALESLDPWDYYRAHSYHVKRAHSHRGGLLQSGSLEGRTPSHACKSAGLEFTNSTCVSYSNIVYHCKYTCTCLCASISYTTIYIYMYIYT